MKSKKYILIRQKQINFVYDTDTWNYILDNTPYTLIPMELYTPGSREHIWSVNN